MYDNLQRSFLSRVQKISRCYKVCEDAELKPFYLSLLIVSKIKSYSVTFDLKM